MNTFHNPYHFVPVKKEGRVGDVEAKLFPANRKHATHDRYVPETQSGRIICRLTTQTPIFVGGVRTKKEASAESPGEVQPFELGGRPAIPASTLRGLFSSLAEAASNSALRILHDAGYSYRRVMDRNQHEMYRPLSAIGMVIVERDGQGTAKYRLLPLTLPLMEFKDGRPVTLDAHWKRLYSETDLEPNLKVYIGDFDSIRNPEFPYQTFSCDHELYYGLKLKRRNWDNGVPGVLARDGDMYIKGGRFLIAQLPLEEGSSGRRDFRPKLWDEISDEEKPLYTRGILRVLGCSSDRADIPKTKKHELFIPYPEGAENWPTFSIREDAIERFHDLADQRTEASVEDPSPWPYEPKGTRRNDDPTNEGRRFRLKNGDLVWYRPAANAAEIDEISLSSIWRGRVETSEGKAASTHTFFEKIDSNLLPFNPNRTLITIAEQLFGFVESSKESITGSSRALAGRVYFSHALLEGGEAANKSAEQTGNGRVATAFLDAVTLKILDSPKPPSPALYFKRATGRPGYVAKRDLKPGLHYPQGRKFYLHHRDREINQPGKEPWRSQHIDPTDTKSRLQQKVKITPLKTGLVFYFHVDFDNLSPQELGLLLYALKPTNEFRHKIGMGKPLGLGCVNIETVGFFSVDRQSRYTADNLFAPRYDEAWVAAGEEQSLWPSPYNLESSARTSSTSVMDLRDTFAREMHPEIKAAIEALGNPKALHAPVHTPLVEGSDPEDETFKWFVENDKRVASRESGVKPAFLSPLPDPSGQLPVLPTHQED
jgi:CRISPR-associated protein (TIGR03986 family)